MQRIHMTWPTTEIQISVLLTDRVCARILDLLKKIEHSIIGKETLHVVPTGSYIINNARAPLVDQYALLRALENVHIAGTWLDVFETEPFPSNHTLRDHPVIFPTPHLAGEDNENLVCEIESWMANTHRITNGKEPLDIVNDIEWNTG